MAVLLHLEHESVRLRKLGATGWNRHAVGLAGSTTLFLRGCLFVAILDDRGALLGCAGFGDFFSNVIDIISSFSCGLRCSLPARGSLRSAWLKTCRPAVVMISTNGCLLSLWGRLLCSHDRLSTGVSCNFIRTTRLSIIILLTTGDLLLLWGTLPGGLWLAVSNSCRGCSRRLDLELSRGLFVMSVSFEYLVLCM